MDLGYKPDSLRVLLEDDTTFKAVLTLSENWPAGASVNLEFPDRNVQWPAAISGAEATITADKAAVNAAVNGEKVALRYIEGTDEQVWAKGWVRK